MSLQAPQRRVSPLMTGKSNEFGVSSSSLLEEDSQLFRIPSMDSSVAFSESSAGTSSWICPQCSYLNVDGDNEKCALCGLKDRSHFVEKPKKNKKKLSWLSLGNSTTAQPDEESQAEDPDVLFSTESHTHLRSIPSDSSKSSTSTRHAPLTRPAREEESDGVECRPLKPLGLGTTRSVSNGDDALVRPISDLSVQPMNGSTLDSFLFGPKPYLRQTSGRNMEATDGSVAGSSQKTAKTSNKKRPLSFPSGTRPTPTFHTARTAPTPAVTAATIATEPRPEQDDSSVASQDQSTKSAASRVSNTSAASGHSTATPSVASHGDLNSVSSSQPGRIGIAPLRQYHSHPSAKKMDVYVIREDFEQSSYLPVAVKDKIQTAHAPVSAPVPAAAPPAALSASAPPSTGAGFAMGTNIATSNVSPSTIALARSSSPEVLVPPQRKESAVVVVHDQHQHQHPKAGDKSDPSHHTAKTQPDSFTSAATYDEDEMSIEVGIMSDMVERGQFAVEESSSSSTAPTSVSHDSTTRKQISTVVRIMTVAVVVALFAIILLVFFLATGAKDKDDNLSSTENSTSPFTGAAPTSPPVSTPWPAPPTLAPVQGVPQTSGPSASPVLDRIEDESGPLVLAAGTTGGSSDRLGLQVSMGGLDGMWAAMVSEGFTRVVEYVPNENSRRGSTEPIGSDIPHSSRFVHVSLSYHEDGRMVSLKDTEMSVHHLVDDDWTVAINTTVVGSLSNGYDISCDISGNGLVAVGAAVGKPSTATAVILTYRQGQWVEDEDALVFSDITRQDDGMAPTSIAPLSVALSYDGGTLAVLVGSTVYVRKRNVVRNILQNNLDEIVTEEEFWTEHGTLPDDLPTDMEAMALSGDGRYLALATATETHVLYYQSFEWQSVDKINAGGDALSINYDGRLIVIGNANEDDQNGVVSIWQLLSTGSRYETLEAIQGTKKSGLGTSVSITKQYASDYSDGTNHLVTVGSPKSGRRSGEVEIYHIN